MVRWVGPVPVHPTNEAILQQAFITTGTQIRKSAAAENETTIVHTVTTGKTLHICTINACARGTGAGNIALAVRDTDDTEQFRFTCAAYKTNASLVVPNQFIPAIQIAAGWDIVIISDAANVVGTGFIYGWEI